MTSSPAVLIALGISLSAPILVWSATRPRPDSGRALVTMCVEIFLTVMLAYLVARFVVMPGLQWLGMHFP